MVSLFDRTICYAGLACLYGWGFYKFSTTQKSFNDNLFEKLKTNAIKYTQNNKDENIKFIHTFNKKLIFIIGVDNNLEGLKRLKTLNNLTENFTIDHFLSEKDINK